MAYRSCPMAREESPGNTGQCTFGNRGCLSRDAQVTESVAENNHQHAGQGENVR